MLLTIQDLSKTIGNKELFNNLSFSIEEGEKVALIGRNGLGKTTLCTLLTGEDKDYEGSIQLGKGIRVVRTLQEHILDPAITAIRYIIESIPDYVTYETIINEYPLHMGDDLQKIETYTDAITIFHEKEYHLKEEQVIDMLAEYGLTREECYLPMMNLSGGQKRFVELVRVIFSQADLALIDEPTNHMDYVGKERFISWLQETKQGVLVITHDRDVLHVVGRILELRDKKFYSYKGNYDQYLAQNSSSMVGTIGTYELSLKQLEKAKEQMLAARVQKLKAKSNKGRIQARIREERFTRQYEALKANLKKPSIWIDKESMEEIADEVVEKYEKYKDRNISIRQGQLQEYKRRLLMVHNLSLGYEVPLFHHINFTLDHESRVFLKGRNGVGKTTLLQAIIATIYNEKSSSHLFEGEITFHEKLRLGVYEQEVQGVLNELTLYKAVEKIYDMLGLDINREKASGIIASYLFNPVTDLDLFVSQLSGGQRARLQLIKILANKPNLLILDEPTNHLDLPSIEELEHALLSYEGAILYVSHDSYFQNALGGETIEISSL